MVLLLHAGGLVAPFVQAEYWLQVGGLVAPLAQVEMQVPLRKLSPGAQLERETLERETPS